MKLRQRCFEIIRPTTQTKTPPQIGPLKKKPQKTRQPPPPQKTPPLGPTRKKKKASKIQQPRNKPKRNRVGVVWCGAEERKDLVQMGGDLRRGKLRKIEIRPVSDDPHYEPVYKEVQPKGTSRGREGKHS